MKLKDKLNAIKTTIVEEYHEYSETANMNAQEFAERYGYQKLLKRVDTEMFRKYCADNSQDIIETSIHIERNEDTVIFIDPEFGTKETYSYSAIKHMFSKSNIKVTEDFDEDCFYLTFSKQFKPSDKLSFEKRLEDIISNPGEYLDKTKDLVAKGSKVARNATKKTLRNLSNWADEHL